MELRDKQVLVVGLARTGMDCARFLVNQGAKVLVSDLRSETISNRQSIPSRLADRYLLRVKSAGG
jgi:UDP-N-acetylmuramoylalanine-D-glutamate ligase